MDSVVGSPRRTSRTQVIITVLDMNDNEPIFDKPSYVGSVIENQAAGVLVLQVSATDADEGINGLIKCVLMPFRAERSCCIKVIVFAATSWNPWTSCRSQSMNRRVKSAPKPRWIENSETIMIS